MNNFASRANERPISPYSKVYGNLGSNYNFQGTSIGSKRVRASSKRGAQVSSNGPVLSPTSQQYGAGNYFYKQAWPGSASGNRRSQSPAANVNRPQYKQNIEPNSQNLVNAFYGHPNSNNYTRGMR